MTLVIDNLSPAFDLLCEIEKNFGFDSDGYEVTLSADEELGLRIIWDVMIYLVDPKWYAYARRGARDVPTRKFWGVAQ